MILVRNKEFAVNQDLALDEQVFIQKGNNLFHLFCSNVDDVNDVDDNDDDYVTKDELLAGIYEDIDTFYANK